MNNAAVKTHPQTYSHTTQNTVLAIRYNVATPQPTMKLCTRAIYWPLLHGIHVLLTNGGERLLVTAVVSFECIGQCIVACLNRERG